MPESIIELFQKDYESHLSFYVGLASYAETRCRKALVESGIPAIVTARAKSPDRLLAKIRQRDAAKNYQSAEDILRDLVDLVGVRIALYFPDQESQIEVILRRLFHVKEVKRHDKTLVPVPNVAVQSDTLQLSTVTAEGPYTPRFHGYKATHFRVTARDEDFSEPDDNTTRRQQTMIEVQVASLLMHAWSQVNHDLAYKTLNGQLSMDELRVLDGINGLVLTGEVLLSQLKVSVEARIAVQKRPFSNYFELGAFVQRYAPYHPAGPGGAYRMGSLSWLLYVTRHLGINYPEALGERLGRWSAEPANLKNYPLVQSILDFIFAEWNAGAAPTLERPFLQPALNDKFQSGMPALEQKLTVSCHILAYACEAKLLLHDGGDEATICLPSAYQRLNDADYLVPDAQFNFPSGEQLEETQRCIRELWDWFVKSSRARARVAFGIARARAGNKCQSLEA